MVTIEAVVELGLSLGLSLALEDVAVGGGVGVVRVAVVVETVGHGVVDTAIVDESRVSLSLALGNVDGAGTLSMVHALASIAHGLHSIIGVGLGLHVHGLVVGDGFVGSSIGGVLVVGHGRVEVCGLSLTLGNVDSAGALSMVHALGSIAHGRHGIIGVGLSLHVHGLVVGDRFVGSSIRDGLVGSGVGGVLVVGHGRVEVRGLGLSLTLAEAVVDVVVAGGVRVVEPEVLRVGSDSQEEHQAGLHCGGW